MNASKVQVVGGAALVWSSMLCGRTCVPDVERVCVLKEMLTLLDGSSVGDDDGDRCQEAFETTNATWERSRLRMAGLLALALG